jgi:type I restriction enzyme, R subunit
MLVDGIAVECRRNDGSIGAEIVRLIDYNNLETNDWLAVNQFTSSKVDTIGAWTS